MGTTPDTPTPGVPDRGDSPAVELGALLGDTGAAESVVEALRATFVVPVPDAVASAHLAAMFAAADAVDPADAAVIDLTTSRRGRFVTGGAIAVAALALTGGLAAANSLPGPLQDLVSRAANVISIDLPSSDDDDVADEESPVVASTPGVTAPGQTGSTPGQSGSTPGQSGSTPGQSGSAPGQSGTAPGQTGETPGQTGETPAVTAPGQTGETPGQTGETPAVTAPGQTDETPGTTVPGPPASTPGDTAPGQGQGQGQGGGRGNRP